MNTQPLPSAPQLGAQVPGTTGGLPALSGLSVTQNPMAQELQSYGRGEDTMLVHMTPNEVNSLQGLAMAHGGSLTINPHTGLPEAGWLGKLLPSLIGFGLNFIPGVGPLMAAGLTAAGTTAITGDLSKGLMAGLGAYGGASLSGAVAPTATGSIAPAVAGATVTTPATTIPGTAAATTGAGAGAGATVAQDLASKTVTIPGQTLATTAPKMYPGGIGGLASRFGDVARAGTGTGMLSKAAPTLAGMGLLGALPSGGVKNQQTGAIDNSYEGPYYAQKREFIPTSTEDLLSSSRQRQHISNVMPEIYNVSGQVVTPGTSTALGAPIRQAVLNPLAKKNQPMYTFVERPWMGGEMQQLAKGGEVDMRDGAFVVDARTVSELGNGSSNAGIELLSKMGGRPVRGPGDGVSDSVPARIDGKQEARVARDEVIFSPEAVRRVGGGSEARGTKKLYALMDKAHAARRKSARGKDTGLRKGLA